METNVILSNGKTVRVRRLGLFEIEDNIERPKLEPYTVTVLFANGELYSQPFDISTPRKKPDKPLSECEENSQEWNEWLEYNRWQNGIVHERKRIDEYANYCYRISKYIRAYAIDQSLPRGLNVDDWHIITQSALCHQVAQADIDKAIVQLKGQYGDDPIGDVYKNIAKSSGSYDFRVIELDKMEQLGQTEEEYFSLPVMDRARLIAKDQIKSMIEALDNDAMIKESKVNNG